MRSEDATDAAHQAEPTSSDDDVGKVAADLSSSPARPVHRPAAQVGRAQDAEDDEDDDEDELVTLDGESESESQLGSSSDAVLITLDGDSDADDREAERMLIGTGWP